MAALSRETTTPRDVLEALSDAVLFARIAAFQHAILLSHAQPVYRMLPGKERQAALTKLRRGSHLERYAAALVQHWDMG